MKSGSSAGAHGFTLIEVLTALLILSLLALMSYRALSTVLETREHVQQESQKWRRLASFFDRFERDVQLAAPRSVRASGETLPAWSGRLDAASRQSLAFSRFASAPGTDVARRVGYTLNDTQEVELWLWPGLDLAPGAAPARYPVLTGVTRFELQYLTSARRWVAEWPVSDREPPIPKAVQVRIVLATGEEIVRLFAL